MEEFEVLLQSEGSSNDTYITVQDIRDEGVSITDANDEKLLQKIIMWQEFIDQITGQFFLPKTKTLYLDGNNSDILFFGIPIISIEYIKINDSEDELEEDYVVVYNRDYPKDRFNPRIKLKTLDSSNIYSGSSCRRIFEKGKQNQIIKGVFGFVDQSGNPPQMIKYAHRKLVIKDLSNLANRDHSVGKTIIEEKTDKHSVKFSSSSSSHLSITGDKEIDEILMMYRRPIKAIVAIGN
ncbi:MAG: hypothetical protein ABIA04_16470 [Pseudomonadota bacterium]